LLLVPRLFQRDEFCDSHRSQEIEHVLDSCRYPADFVASGFQFSHSGESGPPLADWCSGSSGSQSAKPAPNSVKSAFAGGDELVGFLPSAFDLVHEIQRGQKERKSMKVLFWIGTVLMVLGIASFFVPIPHSQREGFKAGGVSIGVETQHRETVPPVVSGAMILAAAGMMIAAKRSRGSN
jgi:hypothetical protein